MYALRQYFGRFERNRSLACGLFVPGEGGEAAVAAAAAAVAAGVAVPVPVPVPVPVVEVIEVEVVVVVVDVLGAAVLSSSSSLTLIVEEEEGIEKRGFSSIDGRLEFDPLELVALSDLRDWIKEARNYCRNLGETSILIGRAIIGIPFVSRNLQIIPYKKSIHFPTRTNVPDSPCLKTKFLHYYFAKIDTFLSRRLGTADPTFDAKTTSITKWTPIEDAGPRRFTRVWYIVLAEINVDKSLKFLYIVNLCVGLDERC